MPRSPAEAQALVDRVLGPLLAYDADHGARLVETVQAFIRADGSWQRAAADVHVHKQTLGYRLRKVEELTGRGFAGPSTWPNGGSPCKHWICSPPAARLSPGGQAAQARLPR